MRGAAPGEIDGAPEHVDDIAPEIDDHGGKVPRLVTMSVTTPWSGQPVSVGNQNQMAGGGNGEKFGDPLNEGKHDNLLK